MILVAAQNIPSAHGDDVAVRWRPLRAMMSLRGLAAQNIIPRQRRGGTRVRRATYAKRVLHAVRLARITELNTVECEIMLLMHPKLKERERRILIASCSQKWLRKEFVTDKRERSNYGFRVRLTRVSHSLRKYY